MHYSNKYASSRGFLVYFFGDVESTNMVILRDKCTLFTGGKMSRGTGEGQEECAPIPTLSTLC